MRALGQLSSYTPNRHARFFAPDFVQNRATQGDCILKYQYPAHVFDTHPTPFKNPGNSHAHEHTSPAIRGTQLLLLIRRYHPGLLLPAFR